MGYKIQKIYVGTNLVWPVTPPQPGGLSGDILDLPFTTASGITDQSGRGLTITNNSVTIDSTIAKGCANFDSGDYLTYTDTWPTNCTISFWVKSTKMACYIITCNYTNNYVKPKVSWHSSYNSMSFQRGSSVTTNDVWFSCSPTPWSGNRVFATLTYDASTGTGILYINGVQQSTHPVGTGQGTSSYTRTVGKSPSDSGYHFQGKLSDLKISSGISSENEILAYYNQTKSDYGIS